MRTIEKGDELTWCYPQGFVHREKTFSEEPKEDFVSEVKRATHFLFLGYEERQAYLKKHYGFDCFCRRCQSEKMDLSVNQKKCAVLKDQYAAFMTSIDQTTMVGHRAVQLYAHTGVTMEDFLNDDNKIEDVNTLSVDVHNKTEDVNNTLSVEKKKSDDNVNSNSLAIGGPHNTAPTFVPSNFDGTNDGTEALTGSEWESLLEKANTLRNSMFACGLNCFRVFAETSGAWAAFDSFRLVQISSSSDEKMVDESINRVKALTEHARDVEIAAFGLRDPGVKILSQRLEKLHYSQMLHHTARRFMKKQKAPGGG